MKTDFKYSFPSKKKKKQKELHSSVIPVPRPVYFQRFVLAVASGFLKSLQQSLREMLWKRAFCYLILMVADANTHWVTVQQLAAEGEKMLSRIITMTTLEILREVRKANWVCAMHAAVRARSLLVCIFGGLGVVF